MRSLFLGGMTALFFLVPTVTMAAVPEVQPANDFVGIGYRVSSSGEVIVYAGVREIGGRLAICGLVWFEKATASTRSIEPKFSEKIVFRIDGKGLAVTTRVFSRFKTEDDAAKGKARCSVTQTAWKASYSKAKLTMTLGNETVYE